MVNSVSFIVCSLMYSLMLMIVYFKKNRKANKINKVYSALVISNFIGLLSIYVSFNSLFLKI